MTSYRLQEDPGSTTENQSERHPTVCVLQCAAQRLGQQSGAMLSAAVGERPRSEWDEALFTEPPAIPLHLH